MSRNFSKTFFPHAGSILVFLFILLGLFFGFTRFYPSWMSEWVSEENDGHVSEEKDPVEEFLSLVRGMVAGVETARQASFRVISSEALAINLLSGYRSGIKIAVVASKNWYDLDRQLFQTTGLISGVSASLESSQRRRVMSTSASSLQLIARLENAMRVDVEELLNENPNRRQTLSNFLNGLKTLEQESSGRIQELQRIVDESRALMQQQLELSQQMRGDGTADSETFLAENSDQNIEPYLDARTKAEEARIRGTTTLEILQRLNTLELRSQQLIAGIEANFEALSVGVKYTPVPAGLNLPLLHQEVTP